MDANTKNEQIRTLTAQLAEAKGLVTEQSKELSKMMDYVQRIGEAGLESATVLGTEGKYIILSNGMYSLDPQTGLRPGDGVLIYPKTGQIVDSDVHIQNRGSIVRVEKALGGQALVTIGGEQRRVALGRLDYVEAGDKVIVDHHGSIILEVFERAVKELNIAPTYWDQIGGQSEAKKLLREAIEERYQYPDLYGAYGKGVPAGGLLYGPPGCGKTLLGKAVATAIGTPKGFISVAGPELLNTYVGETEAGIRVLFNRAAAFYVETGKPAVIFIDEAEALLSARTNHYNFMGQTVVPQFLTMMQGLGHSRAIVLLSTNRPDMLDPAVVREGRMDFKVEVGQPSIEEAREIFTIHIGGRPVMEGHQLDSMIDHAVVTLYSHDKLPHSGALIAGCVDKAITHALRRDLEAAGGGLPQVGGLCEDDFTWGVEQIVQHKAA